MSLKGTIYTHVNHRPHEGVDVKPSGFFVTYRDDSKVDFNLPDAFIKGKILPMVTYHPHDKLANVKIIPYVTYKDDSKVNLWEGSGAEISAKIRGIATYRPHNGMAIRKLLPYIMERSEDKVQTFKIPYGMGGVVSPFIILKIHTLVGYINNSDASIVKTLVLENTPFALKGIQSINDIPVDNNNTADNKGG